MATEIVFLVEDAPEGGCQARAIAQAIFVQAEDLSELRAQVRDSVLCHFEAEHAPKLIRLHFVRDEVIAA